MKERGPIFYDAERVRWRRTRRIMEISGVLLTALLAYFFVNIPASVELLGGLVPDTRPISGALKTSTGPKIVPGPEGRRQPVANIGNLSASSDPLRAAYYVSCDSNSRASLK